jgi:hypothetical protein
MRRVRSGVVALAAICAALAIAALAGATSSNDKYSGPVDLTEVPDDTPGPASVELTVKSKSKKKGSKKLVPKELSKLKLHNVYATCTDGTHVYPADNNSEFDIVFGFDYGGTKIKKRKFSIDDATPPGDEIPATSSSFAMTGKVPRKGAATGTIRITFHRDANPEPADPRYPEPALNCDSGVVSWTADKDLA